MHVLLLPSWYPYSSRPISGVFFRDQAIALKGFGHRVGVVAPIQKSIREVSQTCTIPLRRTYWENDDGVTTLRDEAWAVPKCKRLNAHRWLSTGRKLVRDYFAEVGYPDIIHAHSMLYAGALAAEIKRNHRIPFVVTEHSSSYGLGLIAKWELPLISFAVSESSARLAVSTQLANLLPTFHPQLLRPWTYVPNLVDVDFFGRPSVAKRKETGGKFIFFSAAFLKKNKGMRFLIDAFSRNFSSDKFELWIAGNGEERAALEAHAGRLGTSAKILFLGHLDRNEVAAAMAECDVFVLPSLYETFGVVLIEALAAGKPVIATRCGGPESIVTSRNGLLVPPSDSNALGAAMREIVDGIRYFDSSTIRSDCISQFGRQAVVARLTQIYNSAIAPMANS